MPVSRTRKKKPSRRFQASGGASGMVALQARSMESQFRSVLSQVKRAMETKALTADTAEALRILARIGLEVSEFYVWLDEYQEAQLTAEFERERGKICQSENL